MSETALSGLRALKIAGVYGLICILFLLNLIDIPVFHPETGRQAFLLIGIYFFIIYRPRLLPYLVVFLIGLSLDLVSGGIVGLNALCFMVLAIILRGQRRFLLGQSWQVIWAGFCVATTMILCFQALAYGLTSMHFTPIFPLILNIVISSFVYPLLLPVMIALNRWLAD